MRTVVNVARGQIDSDNLLDFLVHPNMELSPSTTTPAAYAVLADIPFIGTQYLQPGSIDDHVPRLLPRCTLPSLIESTLAPAHRRVVRHRQYDIHQPYHRFQEFLSRTQTEIEDGLDDQSAFDGTIGLDSWPAAPLGATPMTASGHRILVDPEGDAAAVR